MSGKKQRVLSTSSNRPEEEKNPNCWSKFKSLFEDRGFDLEYEYANHRNQVPAAPVNPDPEGYRKIDDRRLSTNQLDVIDKADSLDGELSGVINFYEQFASLGDEKVETVQEEDLFKKSSKYRNRVSMRPSMFLSNIAEETSLGEADIDELELVSKCIVI